MLGGCEMYEQISGLINNIFFILFPLFLFQTFFIKKREDFITSQRLTLTVLFSISIILCMLFPFQLLDTYRFDLRQIPLIIGTIYGGLPVGGALFLVSTIFRIFLGGDGIVLALINQLFILLLILMLRKKYLSTTPIKRFVLLSIIINCIFLLNLILGWIVFDDGIKVIIELFLVILIHQWVFTILTAFFIERMIKVQFMQQKIIENEKVEMVSHLSASISHELRNPLQVIKGVIQLLQDMGYEKEKQDEFYKLIISEIESSEEIINSYLRFARKNKKEVEVISLQDTLDNISKILTPYARQNNVELNVMDSKSDVSVEGNRQQFKQVIINLGRNAIEAMEAGGELRLSFQEDEKGVVLAISDSGIGMSEEQVAQLGEPYFSTKETGTGLGMLVVYSIIQEMKGKVKVESKLGVGTTFKITLPKIKRVTKEKVVVNSFQNL